MNKHTPGDSMTYDEWKDLGFHVRRGEHSSARNEKGQPVFSPSQVDEDEEDMYEAWPEEW